MIIVNAVVAGYFTSLQTQASFLLLYKLKMSLLCGLCGKEMILTNICLLSRCCHSNFLIFLQHLNTEIISLVSFEVLRLPIWNLSIMHGIKYNKLKKKCSFSRKSAKTRLLEKIEKNCVSLKLLKWLYHCIELVLTLPSLQTC